MTQAISSALTVGFAPLSRQQLDDAQEAPGSGQMQRPVAHLAAGIDVSAKLQQQLHQLSEQQTGRGGATHLEGSGLSPQSRVRETAAGRVQSNLLVAVVTGDVQRREEDGILDVDEGSVLQQDVCRLT